MLTSSVKGGQAFISASCQRKPESQTAAAYPPFQTSVSTQPAHLHNGEHLLSVVDLICDNFLFSSLYACTVYTYANPHLLACACVFCTAYINYLSMGTAVIEVGDNLQLILPEGTYPLPETVLTPVCQVPTRNSVTPSYHPVAVAPVQRCRTMAPVPFPAPVAGRKPFLVPGWSSQTSSNASQSAGPVAAAATAKVGSTCGKRRLLQIT